MSTRSQYLTLFLVLIVSTFLFATEVAAQSIDRAKIDSAASSVALILIGDGEGVVTKVSSGIAISSDGTILVPYHIVKDAKQVQVRLKNGEVFDDVVLLGSDERRNVAAIKIAATAVSTSRRAAAEMPEIGSSVLFVSSRPGSVWTSSVGKLTSVGLADAIPGAGEGYRVVQFSADIEGGTDGGVLFDENGDAVGIVTKDVVSGANNGFAVPVSTVVGLGSGERRKSFTSGKNLSVPRSKEAFIAENNPSTHPRDLLINSKTVWVNSRTTFFKEQQLINELNKRKEVKDWGWRFTEGWDSRNTADLIIEIDHQILTFDFTYTIRHRKSSIVIASGKAIITGGSSGAPRMVDNIISKLKAVTVGPQTTK